MEIIIGKGNKIERSSIPLKKGLNVIGDIDGIVVPGIFELRPIDKNVSSSELSQLSPAQINGAAVFIFLRDENHFEWASADFSGICDIFYGTTSDGKHIIGNNFFEILSKFSSVTLEKKDIIFFIRHGCFPMGKTFFKEISRSKIGNKLKFNGNFFEENNFNLEKDKIDINYETFKRIFTSVLECIGIENDDAIFFSGGVDSGLIAALSILKFSKHPIAITERYNQVLKCNRMDWVLAEKIADFLEMKHLIIDVDFNKESVISLVNVVENVPLSAHLSLGLLDLSQKVVEMGIKKVWCGQNADHLYNLGPTAKSSISRGGFIKRFYLSKEYICSLPDISDNKTPLRFLYQTVGELGILAFKTKRGWGWNVRQPKTFKEFLSVYENSEECLPLPFKDKSPIDKNISNNSLSYSAAKKLFFDRKAQYLTSGDSRVVYAAAEKVGIKAILPYSATNMIFFFRHLEMNLGDVLKPKKFIYRYLKEFYSKKQYKKLYSLKKKEYQSKSESFLTWSDWQKAIIQDTKFGQELKEETEKINLPSDFVKRIKNSCDFLNIQHLVGIFWFKSILEKVKNLGISIKTIE